MVRLTLILCLLLSFSKGNAQVTEYNFLGKKWYVAGIDVKLKFNHYSPSYYSAQIHASEHPDQRYSSFLQERNAMFVKGYYTIPFNGVKSSLVMRPFHYNSIGLIRQIEISHSFEYEKLNTLLHLRRPYVNKYENMVFKSSSISYRPSLIFNSPTVLNYFKIYTEINAGTYLPLRSWIYCNSNFNSTNESYKLFDQNFNDRISLLPFKYVYGIGGGLKMNLDCKWNFHIDGAFNLVKVKNNTGGFSTHALRELHFGLRYKLGVTEEKEENESSSKPSVFW